MPQLRQFDPNQIQDPQRQQNGPLIGSAPLAPAPTSAIVEDPRHLDSGSSMGPTERPVSKPGLGQATPGAAGLDANTAFAPPQSSTPSPAEGSVSGGTDPSQPGGSSAAPGMTPFQPISSPSPTGMTSVRRSLYGSAGGLLGGGMGASSLGSTNASDPISALIQMIKNGGSGGSGGGL